jgi:hypothetical protein
VEFREDRNDIREDSEEEDVRRGDNDSMMNVFGLQEKRSGKIATRTICVSFRRNRYAKNAVHGEKRGKKVESTSRSCYPSRQVVTVREFHRQLGQSEEISRTVTRM